MKRGEGRHEGAGEGGGDGKGRGGRKYSVGGRIGPPPPPPSSNWRQSVLGAWAEGRDGWGVGAKEWEVIGGALHWLTKRQCTKIKPVGREMAQSFLYIFSFYQKDCGNNKKWHMFHLWRRSPSHCLWFFFSFSFSLIQVSYFCLSLIRTFSHFLSTSPFSTITYLPLLVHLVRIPSLICHVNI